VNDHDEIKAQIARFEQEMNRRSFRAKSEGERLYVCRSIATQIIKLRNQLPSNRPEMPERLEVGDSIFYPIERMRNGSIKYKRNPDHAVLAIEYIAGVFERPDIIQPYRHLFDKDSNV
jgi:hypothetical protein